MTHKSAPEKVVAVEIPAGTDVDRATYLTLCQMAQYVRESMTDPLVQQAAYRAWQTFGRGRDSAAAKVWGVFWWIKHAVKFETDEDKLLRLGRRMEQDFLLAPSVVLRMARPSEDCDGFSMLASCMLAVLGVPVCFAAVAVDPGEPWRWSHVFALAQTENGLQAVDASHGGWPGWMVPPERIYRWQAFGLNGQALQIPPPAGARAFRGFSGYVPVGGEAVRDGFGGLSRYGLGDCAPDDSSCVDASASSSPVSVQFPFFSSTPASPATPADAFSFLSPGGSIPSGSMGGSLASSAPASSSASNSNWITSLLNNSFALATRTLAPTVQTTVVRDPVTGQIISSSSNVNAVSSSLLPSSLSSMAGGSNLFLLLGVGVVAFLIFSSAGKR